MKVQRKDSVLWEGIPAMMANKEIRDNCLRTIHPDGRQTVEVKGETMSFAKFDKMFPLRMRYKQPKGENVCKKTVFIYK